MVTKLQGTTGILLVNRKRGQCSSVFCDNRSNNGKTDPLSGSRFGRLDCVGCIPKGSRPRRENGGFLEFDDVNLRMRGSNPVWDPGGIRVAARGLCPDAAANDSGEDRNGKCKNAQADGKGFLAFFARTRPGTVTQKSVRLESPLHWMK